VEKHVWQYYWGFDWLGNKVKNIYYGPKLDWMKLFKKKKSDKKKIKKISANSKKHRK